MRRVLLLIVVTARALAQGTPLATFTDNGRFALYLNEERTGTISFEWKSDGSFANRFSFTLGGETAVSNLAVNANRASTFENSSGKTSVERIPEDLLLFDDTSPALITHALLRYDAAKGGVQTFGMVRLSNAEGILLTVDRRGSFDRGGLKLTEWVYAFPGCELHVLAAADGRVYLVSGLPWYVDAGVSEHHAVYVREGYESLRPVDADARYDMKVEAGVKVPMRDGVKLSTDFYRPVGAAKTPVILIRTPYKKEGYELRGRFYARRGYTVAIQDVRGRFASEGEWEALVHEPKDGYDAIEWLATQPWSTGKVGMLGASYHGWVQWLAATLHPPHLVTIIPNVSPPDPFHNIPYENGLVALIPALSWFSLVETNATAEMDGMEKAAAVAARFPELAKQLPVIELDKRVLGRESLTWRQWMSHAPADRYWAPLMILDKMKDLHIPVFHQSAWFDGDGIGSKLNYLALAASGHTIQKLTIGPWGHADIARRMVDGRDYGAAAAVDLQRDYLRWFDHWLKGVENGILDEPLVSLFVMGSNRWLYGPRYPLPETRFEKLYLAGRNRLSFTPPGANEEPDRYVYDPGDPTPEPAMAGSDRAKVTAARKDILVYTTPPFEKPYTLAGPVSAVLYASTSARDTDWVIHLLDVDADGSCSKLWTNASGVMRARYRKSVVKAEMLIPGKVYRYTIDLWHTGVTLPAGHRLRVEVASAALPMFSRNLNTGGNNETESRFVPANQAVYHDARRASYVLLPIIPER
jgi:putative CocE/NonD family hydrolase